MTGMAILAYIRTLDGPNKKTPVILFTAYIEDAKKHNIKMFDNVSFLEKPLNDEAFLKQVRTVLNVK